MTDYSFRLATARDLPVLTKVYNAAVVAGGSSADTAPVDHEARLRWLEAHRDPYAVFIVEAREPGSPSRDIGFAALSVYYDRPGYDGVCDLAYYLAPEWRSRGAGRATLRMLLNECRDRGMRMAVAIIFADNDASTALVRRFGFTRFGLMPKAAYDAKGILHDMSYWYVALGDAPIRK
ncbi:N-acetyl transferase [Bifidobacterium cuniculi]|uniref:N-acetyl transferase n=2 Tax=Bifidobacterium cuniculi TaxID=1688 RepID=A0A087B444_9BIFI|nr:GNAT family N-acetyltransferase [Bifidobacterium cuniculi]KFI65794.1 N-acetyl transferase [Bifidobacterium cuniculi]